MGRKTIYYSTLLFVGLLLFNCSKDDDSKKPDTDQLAITALSTTEGKEGDPVTITGTGFSTTASANTVTFGGTAAEVSSSTPTSISTSVPVGAQTGKIKVTVDGSTAASEATFTVLDSDPVATITNFEPMEGGPGTEVTITGANFDIYTSLEVHFNGTAATIESASNTEIVVTVANGTTSGIITIFGGADSISSDEAFVVPQSNAPTVTSFTPSQGGPDDEVTIVGTNFGNVADDVTVYFHNNNTPAQIFGIDDTQLVVRVPKNSETGPITVSTSNGTFETEDNFTILPPTIDSFTPTSGGSGTEMAIQVSNFGIIFNNVQVNFHGTQTNATINSIMGDILNVVVPDGVETGQIEVTVDDVTVSSAENFTVVPPPVIQGFNPVEGEPGTEVTITGSGFTGSTLVDFNGTMAVPESYTDSEITVLVPNNANTGHITVNTNGQKDVSDSNFTVLANLPPQIYDFNPKIGPQGTVVNITGANFKEGMVVKFGNGIATAPVNNLTSTSFSTVVPAFAVTGPIAITVLGHPTTYSNTNFVVSQ